MAERKIHYPGTAQYTLCAEPIEKCEMTHCLKDITCEMCLGVIQQENPEIYARIAAERAAGGEHVR